jgi:Tol biopolymer transport system component
MMTEEELKEAREFEHCHEYDYCNADGIIENLLDHAEEQQTQLNHRYLDLQQICDDQAKQIDKLSSQIDTLKAECIKFQEMDIIYLNTNCDNARQAAIRSLSMRYPEINWEEPT